MGIFNKDNNPGAYSGSLNCPVCNSPSIRYIENLGPYRQRYRCRKCGIPFQYETGMDGTHPYAPLKNKWKDIVDSKITVNQYLRGRK